MNAPQVLTHAPQARVYIVNIDIQCYNANKQYSHQRAFPLLNNTHINVLPLCYGSTAGTTFFTDRSKLAVVKAETHTDAFKDIFLSILFRKRKKNVGFLASRLNI